MTLRMAHSNKQGCNRDEPDATISQTFDFDGPNIEIYGIGNRKITSSSI